MSLLVFSRRAVIMIAAISLFGGCGSVRSAIAPTAVAFQQITNSKHGDKPGVPSSGTMLYVVDSNSIGYIVSYATGSVTRFADPDQSDAMCGDGLGNVWVATARGVLYRYAHGAQTPNRSLEASSIMQPSQCSIDATWGNLAVCDSVSNNVAVFQNAQGYPTTYSLGSLHALGLSGCTYDNKGNLYAFGPSGINQRILARLPSGGSTFTAITLLNYRKGGAFLL